MFPYNQLPISTVPDLSDQIELTTEFIGEGGYGFVYKGRWLDPANTTPIIVAIKIIKLTPLEDKVKRTKRYKKITRELSLWCSIHHENILPLLGIARMNNDTNLPAFVCPWMENGNAMEFRKRNPDFPPILILYDIINGLHYLHTSQPEIVHGDIKAVNVLINNRCEACLCDFGLSRFLTDNTLWNTTGTQAGGTLRWMAPELMDGDVFTPTKESDIYAYAMTCYELLSGDVPFKSVSNPLAIQTKVMKGQRPDRIESFHSDFMWDIITRCWEQEPDGRLPTEKVLELLLPTVDWKIDLKKEVKEAQDKIGEKDVVLAKVEKEMAVLKLQMAEALAKAEGEMKVLRNNQATAERKKNDVEEKYERKVEELQKLREQFEKIMVMHQAEAAELRQETERAREGSSLLTEELTGLRHTLHEVVETLKHEAKAREEGVHQKQPNKIARLHQEVAKEIEEEMAVLKEQKAEASIATLQRKPYIGTEKSLVIGIDVGTTCSGVSYALLEPGKVPRIQPVTKFPGQAQEKGDLKVPSVVCYDQDGNVIAAGPQTDPEVNPILSDIEGLRRADWFKLRLRLPHMAADKKSQLEKIWSPPQPVDEYADKPEEAEDENEVLIEFEGVGEVQIPDDSLNKKKIPRPVTEDFKTAIQIFADFLQYLFKSVKDYIETEDRTFTWSSVERNTYFVLPHPNGWEGKQQSQMREAAVMAGLVHASTAAYRITFVTEGEASLYFCLDKNPELHQESGGLLVVDGGGGTIDLSAYSQTENGGYKEIASPDCLLQGSIFVTSRARDSFKGKFKDSKYGTDDDVEAMAKAFDKPEGVKCKFNDPTTPYFVKFGGLRDNDPKYGIKHGKFKVEGARVAKFFEPAIKDIVGGIENQRKKAIDRVSIKYVLLVGGFGGSPYLYTTLQNHFKNIGSDIVVLRPDSNHLNKAVADGSVSYYLSAYLSAQIAKYSYGIMVHTVFDPANPEHVRRESTKYTGSDGEDRIPGRFSTILEKGTIITEERRFGWSSSMYFTREEFSQWFKYSKTIKCYKGQAASPPQWVDLEPDSYYDFCIQADMTNVKMNARPTNNGTKKIYQLDFEVVILFCFTELKAYIAWKENGEQKRYVVLQANPNRSNPFLLRSDAFIVYD